MTPRIVRKKPITSFWHPHAHSKYSVLDGMPTPKAMVETVVANGQPALGITDHGNMSGVVPFYKACKANGIVPFIGEEFYIVHDCDDKDAQRYHLIIHALDFKGYQGVVKLSTRSHLRDRFHKKPRIDMYDLAEFAEEYGDHVALLTGCYFGMIVQALVTRNGDTDLAIEIGKKLAGMFPHTYVELQHHNTYTTNEIDDDAIVDLLIEVADAISRPVIVTQDAHYCDKPHKVHHDLMKRVGYYGASGSSEDGTEKDWTFPGDSYHLATTSWVRKHFDPWPEAWDEAEQSYRELLELNKLSIPVLDNYSYHIPAIADDPQSVVTRRCFTSLALMGLDRKKEYINRLKSELGIIDKLGFADYFVLVAQITDHCRDIGCRVSARGSASGSIVCWLMGITQRDPIKSKLGFERFLSLDRTRPPDIDLDIDKFMRDDVIAWMDSQFTIVPIGTYGTLGQDEETGKGSMFVLFMQYERNRLGKEEFQRQYRDVKGMADLPRAKQRELYALAEHEVYKHYGTHAAGLVVTDDSYPVDDLLATMLVARTGKTVTQGTMDDVEDLGFVKIDLLGLRAEYTVAQTLRYIGKSPIDELDWIPEDDYDALMAVRRGNTGSGIFTFEGYTQAKGCQEVRVRSIEDMTLVNALYRPATMYAGYVKKYLACKEGKAKPEYIDGPGGLFEQAFGSTYGIPVYQEQVMDLLRLLGFEQSELNAMLKAIKASNKKIEAAGKTFDDNEIKFRELAERAGMTVRQAKQAWQAILQFSDYSFNRSHAVEYAYRGYYMAYLKMHYPLEFHAALLRGVSMAGDDDKEKMYSLECRRAGIKLLPPDVLVSDSHWTPDFGANGIRRGLTSIKGIGDSVADAIVAARPFKTIEEMIVNAKAYSGRMMPGGKDYVDKANFSGAVLALRDAGAFRSIEDE